MKTLLESLVGKNYRNVPKIINDGKVWYSAKGICLLLGLKNTSASVRGKSPRIGYFAIDEKDIYKNGSYRNSPIYLSEIGIWKLILKSRKPLAHAIKNKLSEEVLVQIMRTGKYGENKGAV